MNDQLRSDIRAFPNAFWLKDPLNGFDLQRATDLWHPPLDLLSFWEEFGTGELFDSEVMLRPFAASRSVEFFTERERKKGLPSHLIAFHYGIFSSAFDSTGFEIFDLESYESLARFESLDTWYIEFIRKSWGERYHLSRRLV